MTDYNFDSYLNEPLPFEVEAAKYFKAKDELTIFEIGSCEGEDSIKLSRRYPSAKVYAFEPLPKNARRMKANFKKYAAPQIKIGQIAFSDKEGVADFYVSSGHPEDMPAVKNWDFGNKSSSLLRPKEHKKVLKWIKFQDKIVVKTMRLDSYCKDNHINNIDLIYLDVQGAELKVLAGAGDFINNIGMIWLEVEAIELYAGQPLKKDVESFMENHGFIKIKDTVNKISGDQLYINKNLQRKGPLRNLFERFEKQWS